MSIGIKITYMFACFKTVLYKINDKIMVFLGFFLITDFTALITVNNFTRYTAFT
jgi:hypothetical protein